MKSGATETTMGARWIRDEKLSRPWMEVRQMVPVIVYHGPCPEDYLR